MKSQTCPNCQRAHDVSVYVTGQRVLCGCGIRFEVRRSAIGVSGLTAAATPSALDATALRAEPPGGFAPTYVAKPVPSLEIPGYVFRELLGRGGMGEVWRAEQQSLGRMVAVKVLPPQSAKDPEFVARFAKEAAALAALSHPNIVQIIDRGMVGEHYYFVMEYVSGKSLREAMAKGPLAPHEATKVAAQICRAMESAHEHHIVHRDLKPENILLDEKGHLKVADFGLAGFRAPDVDHGLTGTAVAMGTLHYMAPEQRRDAARVDGRADLYSLGVVLYEMLTGELPIGRFKLPSERVPGIDTRLDALVSRALEPDPEQRFSSAALMGETLERLLAEASAGPSRWISSVRPAGRAPWRVPLVWGTGVLVLLASLGALGVFWRRASARITDDGHAHAKAGALPPNTDATLGVAALASEAKG
ncbi:MAG: serine/threonine-protein kinase, partial [Myxococcaceae bacterium]